MLLVAVVAIFWLSPTAPSSSGTPTVVVKKNGDQDPDPDKKEPKKENGGTTDRKPKTENKKDETKIKPPGLDQDREVVPLPGAVFDAALGGGGRYLALYMPDEKQVIVFDIAKGSFSKGLTIDADPEDKVRIAASQDKLVVVYSSRARSCATVCPVWREAETKLPPKSPPTYAIAMGSASEGPLAICGVESPRPAETVFYDLMTLKRLEITNNPSPNIFEATPTVFLRASANGRLFTCQPEGRGGSLEACILEGGQLQLFLGGRSLGRFPVPTSDGRYILTDQALSTLKMDGKGGKFFGMHSDGLHGIPAASGLYHLKFLNNGPSQPRVDKGGVPVYQIGQRKPFATSPWTT